MLRRMIRTINRVSNSGKHNYEDCRIPVKSQLNIEAFKWHLINYHDSLVTEFLEFGWPINCEGLVGDRTKVSNHRGATEFPGDVDKFLEEEIELGRVVGPVDMDAFRAPVVTSPLNTREKRDSEERRVILDLTFPGHDSVNTHISKEEYLGEQTELKYPTVDDLIWLINRMGPGCHLFKRDLRKAYRQIPIDPGDVPKLTYRWRDKLYADRVLSMGLRSAAYICQRVSDSVMAIYREMGFKGVVYLDDFAGVEVSAKAEEAFEKLGGLLKELGLAESASKACKPSTSMNFLGIWFCTQTMTMQITPDRLVEIKIELQEWEEKERATRKEMQSLIGKLSFAAKCVRPGRLFLARMLNELWVSPEIENSDLSEDFKKDIAWWSRVMPYFNGISLIPPNYWSSPDTVLACDACLTGAGAVCGKEYFHRRFPAEIMQATSDINQRELLTIMVALTAWASKLQGHRIKILCDNMVTVQVLWTGRARDKYMQMCLREVTWLAAVHQFEIQPQHIEGESNRVPDWLSRWHLDKKFEEMFRKHCKGEKMWEVFIPDSYFKPTNMW